MKVLTLNLAYIELILIIVISIVIEKKDFFQVLSFFLKNGFQKFFCNFLIFHLSITE